MKKLRQILLLLTGLFLVMPIFLVILFQKDIQTILYTTEKEEKYLPGILYHIAEPEMHMETIKALAVLVRSNIRKAVEDGSICNQNLQPEIRTIEFGSDEEKEFYDRLVIACKETEGEVVTYDSKICYCPYFSSSSGTTRDAFSFFKDNRYPYLVAVPSHKDEESNTYITYHYFSIEEFSERMNDLCNGTFQNEIQIIETDEAGYVIWMNIGNAMVGGETFRRVLNLSSSCFSIEMESGGVRIACKGKGHGFGFSSYGANAMAEEHADYRELIEYYFHNIAIENVHTFS